MNSNSFCTESNSSMFFNPVKCSSSNEWSYLFQQFLEHTIMWSLRFTKQSRQTHLSSETLEHWFPEQANQGAMTHHTTWPAKGPVRLEALSFTAGGISWNNYKFWHTHTQCLPAQSPFPGAWCLQAGRWSTGPCLPDFPHFSTKCLSSWETPQSWAKWDWCLSAL